MKIKNMLNESENEVTFDKSKKYFISSGLGGRFTIRYVGIEPATKKLKFKVLNPDFETMIITLSSEEASSKVKEV